jgi:hypothetical protein
MKGAWNLLQEKYQTLIIYGCSAHGLNLLAEDIATLEDFSNIIAHTKKMCRHFAINIFPANYSRKFKQKVEMDKLLMYCCIEKNRVHLLFACVILLWLLLTSFCGTYVIQKCRLQKFLNKRSVL